MLKFDRSYTVQGRSTNPKLQTIISPYFFFALGVASIEKKTERQKNPAFLVLSTKLTQLLVAELKKKETEISSLKNVKKVVFLFPLSFRSEKKKRKKIGVM